MGERADLGFTPQVAAIHTWIREDCPLSLQMIITPKLVSELAARLDAALSRGPNHG